MLTYQRMNANKALQHCLSWTVGSKEPFQPCLFHLHLKAPMHRGVIKRQQGAAGSQQHPSNLKATFPQKTGVKYPLFYLSHPHLRCSTQRRDFSLHDQRGATSLVHRNIRVRREVYRAREGGDSAPSLMRGLPSPVRADSRLISPFLPQLQTQEPVPGTSECKGPHVDHYLQLGRAQLPACVKFN